MNQYNNRNSGNFRVTTGIILLIHLVFSELTLAQVHPDTTLGKEQSNLLLSGDNNNTSPGELITGGARRGDNLFHSFESFNVSDGQGVYFDNPDGIAHIFSRVTGNQSSAILGTLGVWNNLSNQVGNADLFFINPNGIVFGRNAFLDIGGSFVASTASSIIFTNGFEFSSSNSLSPPLLTVSIPVGLRFGTTVSSIRNQSQRITIGANRTLALVGGEIILDRESSISSSSPTEAGGRIELGGVGPIERVDLRAVTAGWALDYQQVQSFADIQLLPSSFVIADGGSNFSNGEIQIQGRNILLDTAQVFAVNEGTQLGGKISIHASELVELRGTTTSFGSVIANITQAAGRSGGIEIVAQNLRLLNGTSITAETLPKSSGQGGNVTIRVSESVELAGDNIMSAKTSGMGRAGNLSIETRELKISEGAQIGVSTDGGGRGGNLVINAPSVVLTGFSSITGVSSAIQVESQENATASGGNLTINSKVLKVTDGAIVSAATRSAARGGDIAINTNTLELINGGQIFSSTFSNGDAGNITINANNSIFLSNQSANFTERLNEFSKKAIENVGPVSGIFANTALDVTGNGGSIFLQTPQLTIQNNAEISTNSQGIGNAGNLTLNSNFLTLDNQGKLTASSQSGEGGNITLNVQDTLLLRDSSFISATAGRTGNGGNIDINTNFLVAFPNENSDITANAFGGRGGAINITATGVFGLAIRDELTPNNDITAFSQLEPALNGIITLNTPEIDPSRGLIELPETVIDPNTLIAQNPCRKGTQSELTITGRGGLPPNPTDDLNPQATEVNLIEPAPTVQTERKQKDSSNPSSRQNPIVPAQGWIYNAKGEVVLTAYNPSVTESQRLQTHSVGCPTP